MSWKTFLVDFASANKAACIKRMLLAMTIGVAGWLYAENGNPLSSKSLAQPAISQIATAQTRPAANRSEDLKLIRSIPGEAVLSYATFGGGGISDETGRMMTSLLTTASMAGLFSANQQILADVMAAIMTVSKYPSAIFMLDAEAREIGIGSFTLNSLQAGMIVRADQEVHGKFLEFIKQTLDHYFTADDAKLTWTGEGELKHQKLESAKFPAWCCWEWGAVGDTFIFSVGPGAYEKIAGTVRTQKGSLYDGVLIQMADQDDADIQKRMFFAYGDFEKLGEKLRPVMGQSYDKILAAFAASDVDRSLLSAGFTDRAFISKIFLDRHGIYLRGYLTGDFPPGDRRARAVPPEATSYGVSYSDIPRAIQYGVDTYLASRNPVKRQKLINNYNKIAEEAGMGDAMKTVFAHMGPMVIIHDWPKHPLNLPIGKTMLIETDGDAGLKDRFDKAMTTWQAMLRALNGEDKATTQKASAIESMFNVQLDRSPSGIWFVHIGPIVLIAGGLDDHYLVLSYAVPAVQANLNYLKTISPATAPVETQNAPTAMR
jgi:hypothetical protein